jgi:cytochrome P450
MIRSDYLGFLESVTTQCGDIGIYERHGAVVLVNSPALARALLIDQPDNLTKGDLQQSVFRALLGDSVSMSEGDRHHRLRLLLAPLLTGRRLARHSGRITQSAERLTVTWPDTDQIDLFAELHRLTLHTLGRLLIDDAILWNEGSEFWIARQTLWQWITGTAGQARNLSAPSCNGPSPDVMSAITTVQGILDEIIRDRLHGGPTVGDLLDDLLSVGSLSSGEVRDQILALLFAGHETSAAALFWALYLLATHPPVRERLENELDVVLDGRVPTVGDLEILPLTRMVIKEAMRLFPPAGRQFRVAADDLTLAGHPIDAGTPVSICHYLLHRRAAFCEPADFDPDRFSSDALTPDPLAYIPFGAGERICLGRHYAMLETRLLLAVLTARFRFEFTAAVRPELAVTLRPHGNPTVRVRRRTPITGRDWRIG